MAELDETTVKNIAARLIQCRVRIWRAKKSVKRLRSEAEERERWEQWEQMEYRRLLQAELEQVTHDEWAERHDIAVLEAADAEFILYWFQQTWLAAVEGSRRLRLWDQAAYGFAALAMVFRQERSDIFYAGAFAKLECLEGDCRHKLLNEHTQEVERLAARIDAELAWFQIVLSVRTKAAEIYQEEFLARVALELDASTNGSPVLCQYIMFCESSERSAIFLEERKSNERLGREWRDESRVHLLPRLEDLTRKGTHREEVENRQLIIEAAEVDRRECIEGMEQAAKFTLLQSNQLLTGKISPWHTIPLKAKELHPVESLTIFETASRDALLTQEDKDFTLVRRCFLNLAPLHGPKDVIIPVPNLRAPKMKENCELETQVIFTEQQGKLLEAELSRRIVIASAEEGHRLALNEEWRVRTREILRLNTKKEIEPAKPRRNVEIQRETYTIAEATERSNIQRCQHAESAALSAAFIVGRNLLQVRELQEQEKTSRSKVDQAQVDSFLRLHVNHAILQSRTLEGVEQRTRQHVGRLQREERHGLGSLFEDELIRTQQRELKRYAKTIQAFMYSQGSCLIRSTLFFRLNQRRRALLDAHTTAVAQITAVLDACVAAYATIETSEHSEREGIVQSAAKEKHVVISALIFRCLSGETAARGVLQAEEHVERVKLEGIFANRLTEADQAMADRKELESFLAAHTSSRERLRSEEAHSAQELLATARVLRSMAVEDWQRLQRLAAWNRSLEFFWEAEIQTRARIVVAEENLREELLETMERRGFHNKRNTEERATLSRREEKARDDIEDQAARQFRHLQNAFREQRVSRVMLSLINDEWLNRCAIRRHDDQEWEELRRKWKDALVAHDQKVATSRIKALSVVAQRRARKLRSHEIAEKAAEAERRLMEKEDVLQTASKNTQAVHKLARSETQVRAATEREALRAWRQLSTSELSQRLFLLQPRTNPHEPAQQYHEEATADTLEPLDVHRLSALCSSLLDTLDQTFAGDAAWDVKFRSLRGLPSLTPKRATADSASTLFATLPDESSQISLPAIGSPTTVAAPTKKPPSPVPLPALTRNATWKPAHSRNSFLD
eukprot:TRINITY_DN4067_c0_g1_i1.p1 TRINITY_DN4067_c0_g1~~TRINITY_DN4067_c0_g1_i1.p1  ORF type:complete len:1091 (-),score=158.38 TRINITY_DN4067_c0_g1_i1:28-3276(-)